MSDLEGIEFGDTQIGATRIHYAKAGDGGRLVVLLHGFPECWYSWRHQLQELSNDYTVVAPDLRGFNLSDKPSLVSDYKIYKVADDVIGLIHHFGHKDAAVIGHDWGGAAAWYIAANYPEYLWKVGSLQTVPPSIWKRNLSLKQILASWYMFFFQLPWLPEFVLSFNNFAALQNALKRTTGVFSEADIAAYKKAWSQPGALTAMLNYYRANIPARLVSRARTTKKITVPTLFVYGEKDTAILPETVKGVSEVVDAPFAEIHIPDAGHWVQQEAKDEVTAVIRDFLSSQEA